MSATSLLLKLFESCLGLGYFTYGTKQKAAVPLVCGLSLMLVPYFVSNVLLLIVLGLGLVAVPYFLRA